MLDTDRIGRARDKALPQLGSVGGGNHFIEMQVDRDDGSVWVMIHCGSRGYGWQTANHYFYAGAELRGLPKNRREESWLRADEPLGREYWAHHNSAANYAVANRHIIVRGVQQALEDVFGATGEVFYEISHNLVQEETLVLPDGTHAARLRASQRRDARVPGGPSRPRRHAVGDDGAPVPRAGLDDRRRGDSVSARPGAYGSGVLREPRRGPRHGARPSEARARAAATTTSTARCATITRTLGGVQIRGIVGNTEHTPLDECGHVYKNFDAVLRVLEGAGIARVAQRLYPVANIKGTD